MDEIALSKVEMSRMCTCVLCCLLHGYPCRSSEDKILVEDGIDEAFRTSNDDDGLC